MEFNKDLSLRPAKELVDHMLEGVPIRIEIPEHKLAAFRTILDDLDLSYEVSL